MALVYPRVYVWLRCANNVEHISLSTMYFLGCISPATRGIFLKHHNCHQGASPSMGFFFLWSLNNKWQFNSRKMYLPGCTSSDIRGISWNSSHITRVSYNRMGIILVAIGQLWQALYLENYVLSRFYLPHHSSDFSESPHRSFCSLPRQTMCLIAIRQ
jgi:hypothetical protein